MNQYFLDLHVHIGRDGDGRAVKITASPQLTLPNILRECLERKGIDLIGIVDCGTSGVLKDLKKMLSCGDLTELSSGGWRYRDRVTLFAGVELETIEADGGRAHHLSFFPYLRNLEDFARLIWTKVKNRQLSSQVCYLSTYQLFQEVRKKGGIFIPAHIFTPYKGLYGNCVSSLRDIFGEKASEIKTVELGLSADQKMALLIPELRDRNFLANSDAHSLDKIGREYNQVMLNAPTFRDLADLLQGKGGQIMANYGLDPQLGKYHRSYCQRCDCSLKGEPPLLTCPLCGEKEKFVLGVLDRIVSIAISAKVKAKVNGIHQSKYYYQVPLGFLPGVGPKTKEKLLQTFHTEMNVLHYTSEKEIAAVVGEKIASLIIRGRQGKLTIKSGGGGVYGQVLNF